jgi:hypothetical protein
MNASAPSSFPEMLARIQKALHVNQRELAAVLGCSARTVSRYYGGGGSFTPTTYAKLAKACHPNDPVLAAHLAQQAGVTLEALGIGVTPAAPVIVVAPATPHLADSIVCAAADALDASPRTIRPALVAALERMKALGMSAADALDALRPSPAKASGKKAADKG